MIVIGVGVAGMLAAIATTGEGVKVELREQSEKPDKKLFITGRGRCNMTNACDVEELLGSMVGNPKFLYNSFYGSTNQDMMDLLGQVRFRLKMERGNRVLPQSGKSSDIISTLSGLMRQAGVKIHLNQRADGLAVEDGIRKGVRYGDRVRAADRVAVATGDLPYPTTGPTRDGLKWALDSGHRPTGPSPALVLFEVKEAETVRELQGLSLKSVEIAVYDGKKELYREFGEVLFTHFGVSGPVLLSANSFCARTTRKKHLRLVIDLKPASSWERLDECILRDLLNSRNKQFKNALNHLHPAKPTPAIIARSGVNPDRKVNEVARKERHGLAEATKSLEFTLTGLRDYKEAVITQDGVSVKDVNLFAMESKKVRSLHFAGEVLDLDVVISGLNLQAAWPTGWMAGKAAASQRRKYRGSLARQNT